MRQPHGRFLDDLRTALRYRWFRRLFAVRLTGQLSDGVFQVALAAYVLFSPQRAATVGQTASAFAVLLLPFTVVGPFAGVFLDRWRRRQVLMWANLTRAVLVFGVALIALAGNRGVLFYAAALIVLGVNRFVLAGLSAAVPHTVDRDRLVIANSVSPTAGTIAATVGGGAGLLAHILVGRGDAANVVVLAAAAALYAGAGAIAATMPVNLLGPATRASAPVWHALGAVVRELVEGARHVTTRRPAITALAAITANRFCYGVVTVMTLLLYRNLFNSPRHPSAGLAGFGTAVGVSGVGFLLAALLTTDAVARFGLARWIVACLVGSAVAELVFASPFRPVPLLIGAFLVGFFAQGQKICTDTSVQRYVDDAYRGRVFALYDMLFNGAYVLAAAFAAVTLPFTGRSEAVVLTLAAIYLAAAILFTIARRHRWKPMPGAPRRCVSGATTPDRRATRYCRFSHHSRNASTARS